jgi:hypothetical protein
LVQFGLCLNRNKEITIQKTEHEKRNKKHLHFFCMENCAIVQEMMEHLHILALKPYKCQQIDPCSDLGKNPIF